jgi:hypothetical protein
MGNAEVTGGRGKGHWGGVLAVVQLWSSLPMGAWCVPHPSLPFDRMAHLNTVGALGSV